MNENEVFENYHFIFQKRLLTILFLWPYQNRSIKLLVWPTIVTLVHSTMIPQMIKLFEELHEVDKDTEIIAENIAGFLYFQGVLSKFYMNIYAEKKLQHLYEEITKDYKEIVEAGERSAMDEFWSFGRILSIVYGSYMLMGCVFFVFTPVILPAVIDVISPLNESRPKMICYYAEYFVDQQKYLYYIVFHTFVSIGLTLVIVTAVDTTFVVVTYHVLGRFSLLIYRLKQLCKFINDGIYGEDELHKYVIDTIKIHKKTIDFADLVRTTYNDCFFFVTGLVVACLSIGTVDIVMNFKNPTNLLRIGFVFIGIVGYMFFVNWPGERFLNISDELGQSIYSCEWYKLPLKTQWLLRFMLMRCSVPCQLTAGPLLQMNFANCGLVLRTAMSYFTALASLS